MLEITIVEVVKPSEKKNAPHLIKVWDFNVYDMNISPYLGEEIHFDTIGNYCRQWAMGRTIFETRQLLENVGRFSHSSRILFNHPLGL